jgi:hypothetical protein
MNKLWVHQEDGNIGITFNGNFIGYVDEKMIAEMDLVGLNHHVADDIAAYLRNTGTIYYPKGETVEVLWTTTAKTLTLSKSIKDKLTFMAHDYKS